MMDKIPYLKDFIDLLNNNQGVLALILFILSFLIAWFSGFLKWIRIEMGKWKRASKIICAWRLSPDNDNPEFFVYKFAPLFQNKTDEIIKNFWINFASSGFELSLSETAQISLFEGWNQRGDALQLVSKDSYKFAPQNFLEPFEITLKLRKKLPAHDAWIYISYGIPNSKKIELNYGLKYKDLEKFIHGRDHSGQVFLKHMGMANNNFWKKI